MGTLTLLALPLLRALGASLRLLPRNGGQVRTTIGDLVVRAVAQSDSAANDILFKRLGGADSFRTFLARRGIAGVRVDRDERHLQTDILGLQWRPEYVDCVRFEDQ